MWSDLQGQVVEHIAGDTELHLHHNNNLSRPGSVLSLMSGPGPLLCRDARRVGRSLRCRWLIHNKLDKQNGWKTAAAAARSEMEKVPL